MRRRIYLIILLVAVALSGFAQNVGDVLYIYRNDGHINGFIAKEVESMSYSNEDADGNVYDEVVTQVVTTADSIYKIPLAVIDSISFVTPKTEYQPDAINISEELMDYVESSDGLTFTLSSSTPGSLIPKVGDKLVTVEMNDKFPIGFAGKVVEVSGTKVTCEAVDLEEVLKQFYFVSSSYGVQNSNALSLAPNKLDAIDYYGSTTFKLPTFPISASSEISVNVVSEDLANKSGEEVSVSVSPQFHITTTLIVNKEQGTYLNTCIVGDIQLEETLSLYCGLEWSHDIPCPQDFSAPIAPFTKMYVEPGIYVKASAIASITAKWQQKFMVAAAFDISTKGGSVTKPACGGKLVAANYDLEGSIDGTIGYGVYLEFGATFLSKTIDKVCCRGELGAELVAHAVLFNSDIVSAAKETKVYERFKNSKIILKDVCNTSIQAELGPLGISQGLPTSYSKDLYTWDIVPTIYDVKLERDSENPECAEVTMKLKGDLAFPVYYGGAVLNTNGDQIDSYIEDFSPLLTHQGKNYEETYEDFFYVPESEDCIFYPKLKVFGYEMLASPSVPLVGIPDLSCPDENHPHMIDLGLPSGTKWSCCNLGAVTPSDRGDHIPWGELNDRAYCSWQSYQYGYYNDDQDYSHLVNIGSNIAGTSYDAAYQSWGGSWRMPTKEQLEELMNQCTTFWTTIDSYKGMKFMGPNKNVIFLPAAGSQGNGFTAAFGGQGFYWSSNIYNQPCYAHNLQFFSKNVYMGAGARCAGLSIRPVSK